jgi:hypothetical protein
MFRHTYRGPGRREWDETGNWAVELVGDEPHVVFYGFSMQARAEVDPKEPRRPGMWPARIDRTLFGRIWFDVDEDVEIYYLKE